MGAATFGGTDKRIVVGSKKVKLNADSAAQELPTVAAEDTNGNTIPLYVKNAILTNPTINNNKADFQPVLSATPDELYDDMTVKEF